MAKNVSPCTFVCTAVLVYHASASNNSLQALLGSTCPCTSSPSLKCPGGTFPLVHRSPLPGFSEKNSRCDIRKCNFRDILQPIV